MAQLNPNFEIDFSDINSYEQIQLINDTQLAKENLLMHRAYQEPADDEIIRNHFSSFTFVDFCPRLFQLAPAPRSHAGGCPGPQHRATAAAAASSSSTNQQQAAAAAAATKCYELETFSDLFERINKWLKLNKDWRVVSMETLVFDCESHFNYLKSSINSAYLPRNTRGLRLFLSPSKSRFSGPQKIGCINVVPRKVSGSHTSSDTEPIVYETLGDILNRLNELLLSRPIEGRILSVETITLPMSNGHVNTESNYFMDGRLNLLHQCTYSASGCSPAAPANGPAPGTAPPQAWSGGDPTRSGHYLIDILRVYYEFGPMVGGLVNLIDFIPRFYSPTPTNVAPSSEGPQAGADSAGSGAQQPQQQVPKEAATESLTRLIRRSLAWFESERKRVLAQTKPADLNEQSSSSSSSRAADRAMVNLKVCNLQVLNKTLLRHQLLNVNPSNVIESISTRSMLHEPMRRRPPIVCGLCNISTGLVAEPQDWCSHLIEQTQTYQLKFVRLAYVVPVHNKYAKSIYPIRSLRVKPPTTATTAGAFSVSGSSSSSASSSSSSSSSSAFSAGTSPAPSSPPNPRSSDQLERQQQQPQSANEPHSGDENDANDGRHHHGDGDNDDEDDEDDDDDNDNDEGDDDEGDDGMAHAAIMKELLNSKQHEQWMKQAALSIVNGTNERHRQDEEAHQLAGVDNALNDAPIGQLTYRLFAPCQLVKSSSCFSINPVNSSSPLARRGSLDLNGSGPSSEEALASSSLLASAGHSQTSLIDRDQSYSSSSGPFFAHLNMNTSDLLAAAASPLTEGSIFGKNSAQHEQGASSNHKYFPSNEFELVDAIKRRMEVYVTTNSMKVIAGETLIINLSDSLSCLSTAIEQTVMRAPTVRSRATTWVCVYVLYAAVDEPQLPGQLLQAQQQQPVQPLVMHSQRPSRQLELINEEEQAEIAEADGNQERENEEQREIEPHFDDDFKCDPVGGKAKEVQDGEDGEAKAGDGREHEEADGDDDSISECHSPANIYNSAYDRTVALPTSPDNSDTTSMPMEPIEVLGSQALDCLWLDETELAELQQRRHYETFQHLDRRRSAPSSKSKSKSAAGKKRKGSKSGRKFHDHDSQCSLI